MAPFLAACPVIFVVAVWWPSTRSAEIAFVTGGFLDGDDGDDDGFFPFFSSLSFFRCNRGGVAGFLASGIARPCNDDYDDDALFLLLPLFVVYSYVGLPPLCCIIV